MKNVVLDLETDGFLELATCIHSMVIRDVETDEVVSCATPPDCNINDARSGYSSFAHGLRILNTAERIYGHNLIAFDRPALKKLLGYEIPWEKVRDTQIIAGMRWTNLKELDAKLVKAGKLPTKLMGKNSLKAWGYRLGVLKGTFNDSEDLNRFKLWTKEMQDYCEQDTLVTTHLVRHIRRAGATPLLAIETEQELREFLVGMESNGCPFDIEKAAVLQGKLSARREGLVAELRKQFGSWYKGCGEFVPASDNKKLGYVSGCPVTKVKLVHFNPGSRQHIAERLEVLYGWKPTKFTDSGQPEVNEDTLESLPPNIPGRDPLIEYLLVVKRLGQLAEGKNAWLKLATKDSPSGGKLTGMHHIHGGIIQNGTITHRGAHIKPNLGQVPKVGNPYGEECRELFCVPDGWVQVGSDASGLELRELSHYLAPFDGGAYGKAVTEGRNEDGTDVHSVNRDALGLSGKKGRDEAKTFIYTAMYGGGDLLLGQRIPPTESEIAVFRTNDEEWRKVKKTLVKRELPHEAYDIACAMKGAALRTRFMKGLPAYAKLSAGVKAKSKANGFLKLHDGRRVPIRHAHAALNSLLQGSGAVVCKLWLVRVARRLKAEFGPQGWKGLWASILWVHDEIQLACRPHIEERVKQICIEEIRAVGEELNMRVNLDGEAKSGRNWKETH